MQELLFPGDSYSTPPGEASFFASHFPTLFFLWKVLNIIRHDGALAAAHRYGGPEWTAGSFHTLKSLERCGINFHVTGMDNIDRAGGPCVFIGNHMSTLETFVLPVFIQPRRDVTFVVKDSLLRYPWFGRVLGARDPIVVKRKNPRADLEGREVIDTVHILEAVQYRRRGEDPFEILTIEN
jgi:1-acyl-sn-glycerol-3-phosphate acyltransferase